MPAGKVRRLQEVVARQGQGAFRAKLLVAYEGTCVMTGTDVPEVLQAAHISPYNGVPTNVVSNGLLLRADIHDLFDRGLVWVAGSMTVAIAPSLKGTLYGKLDGVKMRLPKLVANRPDKARLGQHRRVIAGQSR